MNSTLLRQTLSALAVVVLLGASSANSNSQPPQAIAAHRLFWNTTLNDFTMFSVCAETTGMAVVDGDLVRAARVLAYGQKSLDRGTDALHRMPPDWRDRVGPRLSRAALALAAIGNALHVYMAHGKVSDLKAAQNDQARAEAELVAAADEAKTSYTAMGGKASDLENVPHATQSANAALASAMGDTDTDDQ
ncbi:MAG: hypothetical protein WBV67_02965 [Candidatus Cybelea sp.]